MNEEEPNATAIDLIDRSNKVIIQITSTCSKQKIETTLSKSVMSNYAKDNFRMKFVFIGTQKEGIKGKKYANPYNIQFDTTNDILLTNDLHKKFINLHIDEQVRLISLLKKELDPIVHKETQLILTDTFIDHQFNEFHNTYFMLYHSNM